MPRTPKSSDTQKRSFDITLGNEAHLVRLSKETGRPVTEVLNGELEYVRQFGLPHHHLRRLEVEAASKTSTLRDEVKTRLLAAVVAMPSAPLAPGSVQNETRRTSANFYGPNDAYLLGLCIEQKREFSSVLNRELYFGQTYDLTPELLGRLHQAADAKSTTVRSLVQDLLFRAADSLPEVPPADSNKGRSKRHR